MISDNLRYSEILPSFCLNVWPVRFLFVLSPSGRDFYPFSLARRDLCIFRYFGVLFGAQNFSRKVALRFCNLSAQISWNLLLLGKVFNPSGLFKGLKVANYILHRRCDT